MQNYKTLFQMRRKSQITHYKCLKAEIPQINHNIWEKEYYNYSTVQYIFIIGYFPSFFGYVIIDYLFIGQDFLISPGE